MIKIKDGVEFSVIAPGGYAIIRALKQVSRNIEQDLTITSGTDGEHSGPHDPHKLGKAYDIRSHDMIDDTMKRQVVFSLSTILGSKFYAALESPGTFNEHIHIQVAKFQEFTIFDLLSLGEVTSVIKSA